MNFVMDLSVEEFLTLDAESRMVDEISHIVKKIYDTANILAGETFSKQTPVTELSGEQSRSLMIADAALLSPASVILIDEIENAGVDKVRSLELLVSNNNDDPRTKNEIYSLEMIKKLEKAVTRFDLQQ